MSDSTDPVRGRLRELERAFVAFERGERSRLYESRDSMLGLAEAVEGSAHKQLAPLCEIANRLLGVLIMERSLDEQRSVSVVRELLAYVEAQVAASAEAGGPGGVFHVVNSQKVGELLVQKGLIAPDQLEKALLLQRVSKGKRVGQVLIAMNAIDQRTLDSVLEDQKSETRREETRRSGMAAQQQAAQQKAASSPLRIVPPPVAPMDGTYGGSIPLPPPPGT